jgi:lysophospholipase L1-like esterase
MSFATSVHEKKLTVSRRQEILFKIAMVAIGPLLLIGLLEGVAYLWEQGQANSIYAWELVASRRMEWIRYPEPGFGYTLMKPGSRYKWQNIPVEVNSRGLRGPETTYEKPANTFRILNLGDSIAMGWGVRQEETYGRQLEHQLNGLANDNLSYEVINAGVPGWNLANELAYLEAEGLKYEPDLILLDLTLVNDIYGKNALKKHRRPAIFEWLRVNTYFWPFLTVQLQWLQARAEGQERLSEIDPPTKPGAYFPLDSQAKQWTEAWNRILDMNRLAEENHARLALLLFPLEFQVLDKNYTTLPQDHLTAKAAEAGIPVVDLLPVFQEACQEKSGEACKLEDRYLFADVWMHPSAYGHKLAANETKAFLAKLLE